MTFPSRNIESIALNGQEVSFVASNERMVERVQSASHEDYVLEKMIELSDENSTFWDVGACFGIHTFVGQAYYDFVRAFEPMPANRGALVDNMGVNSFDGIYVEPHALSEEHGSADFAIRQSEDAGHGRHSLDVGGYDSLKKITVSKETGDRISQMNGEVPNVVKIDVEGAEGNVIEGMWQTLASPECKHVILETHEPNPVQPSYEDFGYSLDSIYRMLRKAGFSLRPMEKDYHIHGEK